MSAAAISDIELVQACQTGEVDAFRQLVERYKGLVYAASFGATGDRVLSEDVAQETFISAWRCREDLREPAKLRGWLCGIARNLGHKALRRRGREVPAGLDLDGIAVSRHPASTTPLETTLDRESEQVVWDELQRMPQTYREPLVLFHQQGRSVEQVASDLGLSTDAVKKRLYRGRQFLKASVADAVERTLSQSQPSKGFVAAVVGGFSAGAPVKSSAAAAATAAARTSTVATHGGWIVLGKIALGAVVVAAAIAIWLLSASGGTDRRTAQAAPLPSPSVPAPTRAAVAPADLPPAPPAPAATPAPRPKAAARRAPATPKAPPRSATAALLEDLNQFANNACACTDRACAEKALAALTNLAEAHAGDDLEEELPATGKLQLLRAAKCLENHDVQFPDGDSSGITKDFLRVPERVRTAVFECYALARVRQPELAGMIGLEIALETAPDIGQLITGVNVVQEETTIVDAELLECVTENAFVAEEELERSREDGQPSSWGNVTVRMSLRLPPSGDEKKYSMPIPGDVSDDAQD